MELGQTYRLVIEGYDMNGFGVGHLDNRVVFVEGAMKGEDVIVKIINIHKKYAFAEVVKILTKSEFRCEAICPYFGECGGCDLMHMPYEIEKEIKENKVKNTLKLTDDVKFNPIIQNDNILGYRNKVMVPFQRTIDDEVICGFYAKKSHCIIPMDKCVISNDIANNIIHLIKRYLNVFHVSIYDEVTHSGLFREVMIRNTKNNDFMVVLVVTKDYSFKGLIDLLTNEFPQIKSIYLNINSKQTNVVLSNEFKLVYGDSVIFEDILGLKFQVSASSFMQVNHDQCQKLYTEAFKMADLTKDMNVIDAYCGMGSITLNIAKRVKHVTGIEVVDQAIINANENKKINNIENASFICGKCEDEIQRLATKEKIDVIFVDPPRKGCDEAFLDTVIKMQIPKIIYISCNVATLQRDVEILKKNGYKLEEVTPCDLFSRNSHVECVVSLTKKLDN